MQTISDPQELRMHYSREAEMSTLGSMLLSERAAESCGSILKPEDFYVPAHTILFTCMKALLAQDAPIDYLTLKQIVKDRGKLPDVGGEDYLIEIASYVPSPSNSDYYAQIVQEKAFYRSVTAACQA